MNTCESSMLTLNFRVFTLWSRVLCSCFSFQLSPLLCWRSLPTTHRQQEARLGKNLLGLNTKALNHCLSFNIPSEEMMKYSTPLLRVPSRSRNPILLFNYMLTFLYNFDGQNFDGQTKLWYHWHTQIWANQKTFSSYFGIMLHVMSP